MQASLIRGKWGEMITVEKKEMVAQDVCDAAARVASDRPLRRASIKLPATLPREEARGGRSGPGRIRQRASRTERRRSPLEHTRAGSMQSSSIIPSPLDAHWSLALGYLQAARAGHVHRKRYSSNHTVLLSAHTSNRQQLNATPHDIGAQPTQEAMKI